MDMNTLLPIIVQLISGAVGGNAAGAVMKDQSLGTIGNSIAGLAGGGLGAVILSALNLFTTGGGGMDATSVAGGVAGGGVGGAVVMIIVGLIKKALGK
jgi:uncharacterized membrane protein YeaQ/YmgE (transglycosylase-associated protein family)